MKISMFSIAAMIAFALVFNSSAFAGVEETSGPFKIVKSTQDLVQAIPLSLLNRLGTSSVVEGLTRKGAKCSVEFRVQNLGLLVTIYEGQDVDTVLVPVKNTMILKTILSEDEIRTELRPTERPILTGQVHFGEFKGQEKVLVILMLASGPQLSCLIP